MSSKPAAAKTAKLFEHGRSQAVRLPKEFRFSGDRVQIRREGRAVILEPMFPDVDAWFAALDRFGDTGFLEDGRNQPPTPPSRVDFDAE